MNATVIDITGNWQDGTKFVPKIQVKEPWIIDGAPKCFNQSIVLPQSSFSLILEYDTRLDKKHGQAIHGDFENFDGLTVNGEKQALVFIRNADNPEIFTAMCRFEVTKAFVPVNLALVIYNTRVMRTFLHSILPIPASSKYFAVQPEEGGELLEVASIPFLLRQFSSCHSTKHFEDKCGIQRWRNGMSLSSHGAHINTLYLLGMTHLFDGANAAWYCPKGDHGYSHFVGDKAGEIILEADDGEEIRIPLIFGFNLWYCAPWDVVWHYTPEREKGNYDSVMFCGEERYRDIIRDGVGLADGVRQMGAETHNARFIFAVSLAGRGIRSIKVVSSDDMHGFPVISAITAQTCDETCGLIPLPKLSPDMLGVVPHTLESIANKNYLEGIEEIKRVFYTFAEELPDLKVPEKPEGYFGPEYDFRGTREAVYAATYLYYNSAECAAYIADTGTECRSSTAKWALHHYTLGLGVWVEMKPLYNGLAEWFRLYREREPGQLPGCRNAWTRGAGELLREALAFGYDKFVNTYIEWLDNCLFTEANPPHWNRVAGVADPEFSYKKIMVGEIEERGNRENDGHGICMWGRYMAWHWLGRSKEWNKEHWDATKASVEWIQWQLNNDTIRPGVRKDVLYTESECAHDSYDFYSSYNCLHGIRLAIRLADQLGKQEESTRWRTLYGRLAQGIIDHLMSDSSFGPIWFTEPVCDWQDHAHKLAHLHLATEGITYTPLEDYARCNGFDNRYLQIDLNTYKYLMEGKNYDCLRMYGYGQGMMTQAALLLDEMEDAEKFAGMLLTHCYLPKFGRWLSPEGIVLHRSGEYYVPINGYRGQDSHVADSTKAIRLMLGVDDNDPEHLRIIPRFPESWNDCAIDSYPVMAGVTRCRMTYRFTKTKQGMRLLYGFDASPARISVRLGPLSAGKRVSAAELNGRPVLFEQIHSGDSDWVWVRNIMGNTGDISISYISCSEM